MTNPLTNIAGVYKITMRRIVFDTGFNKDTIQQIIERFEQAGKAYLHGEYLIIPSWPDHQRWSTSDDTRKGIDRVLSELPASILNFLQKVHYRYPSQAPPGGSIGGHGGVYRGPIGERTYLDSNLDLDLDSNMPGSVEPDIFPEPSETLPEKTNPETQLYHAIKDSFESKYGEFEPGIYGKEGAAIKQLIKKATARSPDNPTAFVKAMCEQFWKLKTEDPFIGKQPFLPSALNSSGIWPRVLETLRTQEVDPVVAERIKELMA